MTPMHHFTAIGLSMLAAATAAPCQAEFQGPLPAPPVVLSALNATAATMQDLTLPAGLPSNLQVRVQLAGRAVTLQLTPFNVRSPNFKLLVDDGIQLREIPAPPSTTYRGTVVGEPGSIVTAALLNRQLEATVYLGESTWGIQASNELVPSLPQTSHVVYRAADLKSGGQCGVPDVHVHTPQNTPQAPPAAALKEAEIAIDVTNAAYRLWGSNTTTVNTRVDQTLNNVDVIYTRDTEITYKLTQTIIRTTAVYTSNTTAVLGQFSSRWRNNHQSVVRDVAHMFTGRSSSSIAGVANISAICGTGRNYGVTWFQSSTITRAGVAAHELGHNWSAGHCSGSGCFLMCAGLGGCGRSITKFGTASINRIVGYKNTRTCLSNPVTNAPTLTSVTPNSTTSHIPVLVTLKGTDLNTLSSLQLGSTTLAPSAYTVVDPTTITFMTPSPFEIATHQITATNSTGTSNSMNMSILGTHPSVLMGPFFHVRGLQQPYTFHTDRNWVAALFVSTSNTPSVLPGVVSMGIGAGFSDLTLIGNLPADNTGTTSVSLTIPTSIPTGLLLYFQGITFALPVTPLETSNVLNVTVF